MDLKRLAIDAAEGAIFGLAGGEVVEHFVDQVEMPQPWTAVVAAGVVATTGLLKQLRSGGQ